MPVGIIRHVVYPPFARFINVHPGWFSSSHADTRDVHALSGELTPAPAAVDEPSTTMRFRASTPDAKNNDSIRVTIICDIRGIIVVTVDILLSVFPDDNSNHDK